ncbi:major facilitator superfamily multidrug resistance transporter EmrA/FusE [Neokomagataea thailandica NBRC 106555]|uniref:Membrane fusion protein (MFP) family protein n=2 Tax=Neokomagataea TaxID=1223423 RepID=A0A4Y6V414_9PROT|nr:MULTISPECIES: HlyD family type I secretion periplasmic adaptor subunit [Neokomagataea]QDH24862.1 HlyD family type I secretion periplasmic adaptor subunit [Neokomagataea tanensis]GBR50179.1 major facilitator superfamily multidrug resistance transporter EmrA/FusE [Neokomagataea thailandica NBRC 106555]
MAASDMTPHNDSEHNNAQIHEGPTGPRPATDPFAPGDMPIALLEFHSPTQGYVNLPATASARYMVWLVACLFFACLVGMIWFPINRVVSTSGRLTSTQPTILVQPLEISIVKSIDVHVGDYVHKGDVLAHLDPTLTGADIVNTQLQVASYQAEADRLRAEAEERMYTPDMKVPASVQQAAAFQRRHAEYTARMEDYNQQIAGIQNDLQGTRASAAMYGSKTRLYSEVLKMRQREQADQVGSRLSALSAQSDLMEAERAEIAAQQTANSLANKLAATRAEQESYAANWKAQIYTNLSDTQHRLDEYRSEYEKAHLRHDLILLRAPEDGIVLTIAKVSIGSVMQSAEQFITLVPTGAGLELEAVMQASDAAFVQQGNRALVKFAAFPYTQYGGAEATVHVISADSFAPESSSEVSDKMYYRVRLRIDRYTLHGQPSFFHPAPGMPATADINVGKRTVMQYLFNNIAPLISNGMREP